MTEVFKTVSYFRCLVIDVNEVLTGQAINNSFIMLQLDMLLCLIILTWENVDFFKSSMNKAFIGICSAKAVSSRHGWPKILKQTIKQNRALWGT